MSTITTQDGVAIFYKDWARRTPNRSLLKNSTLKIFEEFPHGMCTTHADSVNPLLFAFIKS